MRPALKQHEARGTTIGSWSDSLTLDLLPSGVALLSFNVKGGPNLLSSEVLNYYKASLDLIEKDDSVKAVVINSPKPDQFLLGADIREILKFENRGQAADLARRGQESFNRMLKMSKPFVAAISGMCLGGGLEISLCCDARIAAESPKVLLGLPEVSLGVVPGLGGTQRLYRMIGLKVALEMILSSEPISYLRALDLGLVDAICTPDQLLAVAEAKAIDLVKSNGAHLAERARREQEVEEKEGGLAKRQSLLKMSDRAVRIKTRGYYPAPRRAIEIIQTGLTEGLEAGLQAEVDAFGDLASSAIARHMINLYISKEMAVQIGNRALEQAGHVTTLGIIGTSTMGTGIAELALASGASVLLKGSSPEKSAREAARLNKKIEVLRGEKDSEGAKNDSADSAEGYPRVSVAETDDDLRPAQIIIEAVTEDLDLKNKVIYELSRLVKNDCIIASNTSSFAVSNLSQFSNRAERVIGMHFFNPVDRMPLVEVVTHERTDASVLKRALALVAQLGKVSITVKDSPGFLVNRLFCLYMLEAARMMDEGVPLNWIEDVAINFGMPIPPMGLYDEIGWKLSSNVADMLCQRLGTRHLPPPVMYRTVALGDLDGKRTGGGYYKFDDSGRRTSLDAETCKRTLVNLADEKADEETQRLIRDRLFLSMIDEAARCLAEKVVRKPRDIDLALVLGIGFPPFRGGLLRYADDLGIDYIVERLDEIYLKFEPKRQVSDMLRSLQSQKRRFYGLANA